MDKVLIAGATGTLGRNLVEELSQRGYPLRILVRKEHQVQQFRHITDDIFVGQVTNSATLYGVANGAKTVFSSIGITRQKDGLTYQDVDYRGNRNLLDESISAGADRFVYVASLHGEQMRHLKMIEAKEKFVDKLKKAPIKYTIVRPNGFYSDLKEILKMAKKGRVWLPGKGQYKVNPISTADLARVVIDLYEQNVEEANIGGPEVHTQREIAELAFEVLGKKSNISFIPEGILHALIKIMRIVTPLSFYGPLEFFSTVSTRNMIAKRYGSLTLKEFFKSYHLENI
jgi:uncharacterized protein YbjT (DUF2867 family)